MRPRTADRVTRSLKAELPFETGDRLDQQTFHQLYKQTPEWIKAELIGGIVYVASPTSFRHGRPHARMVYWLGTYGGELPGVEVFDNTTNILADESEPQPDAGMFFLPEYGGKMTEDEEGILNGPADLVVEVANTSVALDMHAKKRDYEAAGVREYLVVRVKQEDAVWFARGRKGFTELKPEPDGVLRSRVFPGLWLDPSAVFDKTTRRLMAVLRQGLASPEHAAFVAKLESRAKKRKPK
ncbi:MAG TPA: Uma2 family endonuclease [Fimbriiglobus sp.]|nr:Uma2 family endonuclease [Fimbriiglobus sp.]